MNDPNHSAKHNFWFQTFQKFYFCCRQKFLAQKCVIFVWLKVKMCRNGSFCVEISAGNKIKIFESIIARRIFCIITMRFYLSKPAISSWSKFCNGKGGFFNVTGVQKIGEQLLENFQIHVCDFCSKMSEIFEISKFWKYKWLLEATTWAVELIRGTLESSRWGL